MSAVDTSLRRIRAARPLIHCVSNIVTANDCANLLLAVGASPMMAQAPEEMADIAAISSAAVLNLGTPDSGRFELCAQRAALAEKLGQPCVVDPVGAGASQWRLTNISAMLRRIRPTIVRVNYSEARALLGAPARERGVDSAEEAGGDERAACAEALASMLHTTVLLSGAADSVSDGAQTLCIAGGSALTSSITGAGCMLSALCGAFAAVESNALQAAAAASAFWKQCAGEAARRAQDGGPGSFHAALFDAAHALSRQSEGE